MRALAAQRHARPPGFLGVDEVAERAGVTRQGVIWWERSGKLAATRSASGARLFRRADVERFLKARERADG